MILIGCTKKTSYENRDAVDGVLDLSHWESDKEIVNLDGEWEFYWNQLLEPQELEIGDIQKTGYIDVPSSWNRSKINNKKLSGDGYATYRLIFKASEATRLGIKVPRIFTSYNLWVNGEFVADAGIVGKSREMMTPQYLPQVALFESQKGKNEIVIQVSNFYHRSGGILESLVMGSEKEVLEMRYKSMAYELFLFGSLMIMGAYHIVLYLFRKKDITPLYFGLFCIFVGIRTLLVGERFFIYLFPDFSWELAHKIQTLTFYLGVPLILKFFELVFSKVFKAKIVNIVWKVGIAFCILVIVTPAKVFTIFNPVYQAVSLVVIIYIVSMFIKLIMHKEKEVELVIIGGLILIMTSLNDIIFTNIWMNDYNYPLLRTLFKTGNLSSIGQLSFVVANSLVLAKRFSTTFEQKEIMTMKLEQINFNLDKLVVERTEELEKSRAEIERQKSELQEANQELKLLSLKDPLTGLWNRRHYDETMSMEWNYALKHKKSISLMILDIDYFKAYNDYYGHKQGDVCLIQVGQAIQNFFNCDSNLVARYGGEEFVVIMPNVEKDEAINIASSLRETIENLNIPHKGSSIGPYVTVSIGVTSMIPTESTSIKELFLTVDKALYQAKNSGRNQIRFLIE